MMFDDANLVNVAYDAHIFHDQRYGGVSRYFTELIPHLNRLGGVRAGVVVPLFINEYLRRSSRSLPVFGQYVPGGIFGARRLARLVNGFFLPLALRLRANAY